MDTAEARLLQDPNETARTQMIALFQSGLSIEAIARALQRPELDVKQVVNANVEECGLNGEITYSPSELTMVKAQILRIGLNGENDSVRLKALLHIADQHVISQETRFRAKHGFRENGQSNVTNIMLAVQAAKQKGDEHG